MLIHWDSIETVLLDMDGTLLDLHFDNYFWQHYLPTMYAKTHNIALADAFAELTQRFEAKKGSLGWYSVDYWSNELQLNVMQLKIDIKNKIAVRPFVTTFLSQIRQLNKKVVLITNAHQHSLALKMQQTGLSHFFDAMISTHELGMPKENNALWSTLNQRFHFTPSRTLLIDDGEHILDSAANYGIQHLVTLKQPDSQQPLRQQLRYPAILHFDEIMPHD